MELIRNQGAAKYQIKSYHPGRIQVNEIWYEHPIIVMPDILITPWQVPSWQALVAKHFEVLIEHNPALLLLGSGSNPPFKHGKIVQSLQKLSVGFEAMHSAAACRTYNVLLGEGKYVAAALFP